MGRLFNDIRDAVREGHYVFSAHADERLRERKIMAWQVIAAVEEAELVSERMHDLPNPSVELHMMLADGTNVHSVWAWLARSRMAKLVTVFYFDKP